MDYDEFDLLPDDITDSLFAALDHFNPQHCEQCGCIWEGEDLPVCPICNPEVLEDEEED